MRRVTDKDIPKLHPHSGSWMLIRKATGECIGEVMRDNKGWLKSLNADTVKIVCAYEYLAGLNHALEMERRPKYTGCCDGARDPLNKITRRENGEY